MSTEVPLESEGEGRGGRRAARRARREGGGRIEQPAFRRIFNPYAPTRAISDDELEAIHLASLQVLEEIGIDFLLPEARERLKAAGASVDSLLEALRSTFLDEVLEDRPLEVSTWSVTLELADGSQRGLRVAAPGGGLEASGVDASVLGGAYRVLLGGPAWRRLQAAPAALLP